MHHDDAGFGTSKTIRGNLTGIQRWVVNTTNLPTVAMTYDTTGQMIQQTDTAGNSTNFYYSDSFYNDNGLNPPASYTPSGGPTNAYLTRVQHPILGSEYFSYYYGTGKQALATDVNSATSYQHFVDPLDRPSQANAPTGGWSLMTYTSTQQDMYTGITSSTPSTSCTSCVHNQATVDGLGRPNRVSIVNDPEGPVYSDESLVLGQFQFPQTRFSI